MTPIRKAVLPVAGLGTRFLPATKAMPKEMLPVVDRPLIQHVVDEARQAGIEHFIFVTGRNKGVIEDHFDRQFELEMTLLERGRSTGLELLARTCRRRAQTSFTRQQQPLGLGHAVWCARDIVGHEPFALLLPDVLVQRGAGCMAQMIDADQKLPRAANIVAVEEVPRGPRRIMYGVVGVGESARARPSRSPRMVEKPPRDSAPSNLIITGRYILQPEIFDILATQERGAGGEIQLTDAMIRLAQTQPFYGLKFEGRSFDCGSKIGFLAANVAYALARDDIAPAFAPRSRRCSADRRPAKTRRCAATVARGALLPTKRSRTILMDKPMAAAADLSVVVPTFNERHNIGELVRLLDAALEGIAWEVIFVDDDSRDGTAEEARTIARTNSRVRCIQRIGRRGLSSACVEGMLASSAPFLAVMDADLQHDETILPAMLARLQRDDLDIVIGSRYVDGGGIGEWENRRAVMSRFATRLSRMVSRADLKDPMSGYFVIRREAFMGAVRDLSSIGFKILLDLFASSPRPLAFREMPYRFRPRKAGESKLIPPRYGII